jgi:antirestriction protein ArdC
LKGHLKSGSIGVPIFYWNIKEREVINDAGEREVRKAFFLRNYIAFNVEQTDIKIEKEEKKTLTPLESCERVVASYKDKPVIAQISQSRAYYSPIEDKIVLPLKEQFKNIFAFYSTQFHELSHSTGHEKRLKREGIMNHDFFGSDVYGEEEIIAELSTIFLCASAGIEHETLNNNSAYIKSWLENISKDKTFLFKVVGKGQKSADYIVKNKMQEAN